MSGVHAQLVLRRFCMHNTILFDHGVVIIV
jgi:hypothetical protein